ncbi:MAG TPA: SRPBCC family protein [Chthoniobacterales bacterium]|nr:SRPBCC family protein [Chthoniobacterales bacterium]
MKIRHFESELWVPRPRDEVFSFFADPANLEAITPPWLQFHCRTPGPIEMQAGTLIDYQLRVHRFPLRWRTRIAKWEPPARFVDEQLRGPYRLWVHEHEFEAQDAGTLVRDRVRYAVRCDFLVHRLFVRRDIALIFAYRTEQLRLRFPGNLRD